MGRHFGWYGSLDIDSLGKVEGSHPSLVQRRKGKLGGFQGDYPSSFQVFLNEGFASFHFCWVERIDFGDLGSEVGMKFNCVVVGAMGRELIMGFLGEDILEVLTPLR